MKNIDNRPAIMETPRTWLMSHATSIRGLSPRDRGNQPRHCGGRRSFRQPADVPLRSVTRTSKRATGHPHRFAAIA